MSDVHVKGLADLQKVLDSLPANIERNVMRGALRAGSLVFQREARARVHDAEPSDTNRRLHGGRRGLLRDSVRVLVTFKNGQLKAITRAGGKVKSGGDAYYASWVEKGTKPHTIKAKQAKSLFTGTGSGGRSWTVTQVQHPGAKPRPFMTPAFDAGAQGAVVAVREYVRKRLANKHGVTVPGPGDDA